jgi:NADPH:quinone reductase-like Zn-dependent oxidoreductase
MRAVVYESYGPPDVLRLEEVEQPVPKDHEVLVRIHATAVTRADCATREANRDVVEAASYVETEEKTGDVILTTNSGQASRF